MFDNCFVTDVNSIGSDKNNKFYDCVKEINVEQSDLDEIHTAENNISIKQNIGNNFKLFILNLKELNE